jgi:hypothetical protein
MPKLVKKVEHILDPEVSSINGVIPKNSHFEPSGLSLVATHLIIAIGANRYFHLFKVALWGSAHGTHPGVWQIFEFGSRGDSVLWITLYLIVDISADDREVLVHKNTPAFIVCEISEAIL